MDEQNQPQDSSGGTGKYAIVIAIIVLAVAGISLSNSKTNVTNPKNQSASAETSVSTSPADTEVVQDKATTETVAPKTVMIAYSDKGFSPSMVTIKSGDTVTFVNQSGEAMWIGADEHPTHTQYSGTKLREHCPDTAGVAFDQCSRGKEYSFTFNKIGSWGYHNHSNASMTGVVVVEK
ncbi:MAG: hypothetical protein EXS59_00105 [Candidatus Taylorbacteria bacterium]|nr:hypothetical protein [Candidatus Taylorbacteria bacterium]